MSEKKGAEIQFHILLRRNILTMLYRLFQELPYASVELSQIQEECGTSIRDLNWNLVYLEKCGYVELGKSVEAPPFVACSAAITTLGIDLVENEGEFNRRFPAQEREKGSDKD